MSVVTRLVTYVDLREGADDPAQISVTARHEAVLEDGRRVLLLDDRGWSAETFTAFPAGDGMRKERHPDAWATTSVEEIEQTARVVVGPDEPVDGASYEAAEDGHWAYLSDLLAQQGVVAEAQDLRRLPHDVVLSERLRARAS
jgi:hypothetical protein